MQINLLNMYNLDLQTYMLWDTEKQVTLLSQLYSYWFIWIVQAKQGSDAEFERKAGNINSRKTMLNPHIWEHYTSWPPKLLYFNNKKDYNSITIASPSIQL